MVLNTLLRRFERLQKKILEKGCEAFLIEDKINLYYYTGLELSAGMLLATHEGGKLLVDNRYFERAQQLSPFPVLLSESATLKDLLKDVKQIGVDGTLVSHQKFKEFEQLTPEKRWISHPNILRILRMIKDEQEIQALKKAADLGVQGFHFLETQFRESVTEQELAQELEIFWKRLGSKGVAFEPIIAFGANSSMPHYRAGRTTLKQGTHILVDIGVNLDHYHSDRTRVFFFGLPDPKIAKIYDLVQEAQRGALDICSPGTLIGELDKVARGVIAAEGYDQLFTHSLGHGVGLEIHEEPFLRGKPPVSEMPLEAGMVITLEPGIYLPGQGGVRYEDTVLITPTGYEILTSS